MSIHLLPGIMLIVVGIVAFTVPWWVPAISDATASPEAYRRAGEVGGMIIGLGIGALIFGLIKRRK